MRSILSLLLLCLVTATAWAQDKPKLEPLPFIPPPPGIVDPSLEPQITIVQRGEDRVEEYRVKGQLYMVKITPKHGKPYFLVDPKGNGQMVRHDDLSPNFQVPMWVIHQF